jgi:hypothetical protein
MDKETKDVLKAVSQVVGALFGDEVYHATKYLSPKLVVKASRKLYRVYGRKIRKGQSMDVVLKIGRPNYEQRKFIDDCKKAGVVFPVRNVQLKFPPKPHKKASR